MNQRNGAIRGTYIVDPSLHPLPVPREEGGLVDIVKVCIAALGVGVPPVAEGERKNLYLHTQDGSVDVDVWLVGHKDRSSKGSGKRTLLHVSSNDGSITTKVQAIDAIDPFSLNVFTKDGKITVLLPRSFHGPITMTSGDGSCTLSDDMLKTSTYLGVADRTTRYFVGQYSPSSMQQVWEGDEVKVETRDGNIRLRYVDEVVQLFSFSSSWCVFSRLFPNCWSTDSYS